MQKVTCPQCRTVVEINPDAPLCRVCSADLRTLLTPDATTRYFYQRASELAAAGQLDKALSEVNRGLSYEDDSDLRLLGAILAKRIGDYTQMRSHVAAIPVDDVLRSEGEWLIRSLHESAGAIAGVGASSRTGGASKSAKSSSSSKQRSAWPLLLGFAAVALILLALVWFTNMFGVRNSLDALAGGDSTETGAPDTAATATAEASTIVAAASVSPAQDEPAQDDGQTAPSADAEPTAVPTDTPTATLEPTPTETPLPTVTPTPDPAFDVTDYLMARGYPGLAVLDLLGTLEEGTLVITGTVSTVDQQRLLLDALKAHPSIAEIDAANLRLEVPETYTVGEGDSLWIISNKIYGDSTYMDDIFLLNRDILPSPEVLVLGMELKLPRVREDDE